MGSTRRVRSPNEHRTGSPAAAEQDQGSEGLIVDQPDDGLDARGGHRLHHHTLHAVTERRSHCSEGPDDVPAGGLQTEPTDAADIALVDQIGAVRLDRDGICAQAAGGLYGLVGRCDNPAR